GAFVFSTTTVFLLVVLMLSTIATFHVDAFQGASLSTNHMNRAISSSSPPDVYSTPSALSLSSNDNSSTDRFSRKVRLREEAESPFRKVRYFLYLNLAGGAITSLFISITRIAAALSGVNTDLMDESVRNAIVDTVGLAAVAYFWKQDQISEESRLKRATKGAELAKLNVRASKALLLNGAVSSDELQQKVGSGLGSSTFTTTLSSFRRERGIEKRVVVAAAGKDKIEQVMQQAQQLQNDLQENDLVVVPIVMPNGVAPILNDDIMSTLPTNVALPVTVSNNFWKTMVDEEAAEAVSQGVNIEEEGFCIIVKKNGRIGQRTRGIFLDNLVGNVVARKEAGMDVKNI
ncbi:MAG: hypothetical protein SGILL_008725, partial [Bacillariaceae sp.]